MIVDCYDPGKTTGFASFLDGRINEIKEIPDTEIIQWINERSPDAIVMENYRVRPKKLTKGWDHKWTSPVALKIIGALEMKAAQLDIPILTQEPAIKPVGYGWAGMKYVAGKKGTHVQDAIAHGVYWLVKNEHAKPGSFSLANKN